MSKRGVPSITDTCYLTVPITVGSSRKQKSNQGGWRSWRRSYGWELRGERLPALSRLSPRKCSFWTPSPERAASSISRPPNPSLACSRALRSKIITSSNREAALRACCALLSIIHLRLHNHCNTHIPVPYLLEKSHQCSGGYLRNQRQKS